MRRGVGWEVGCLEGEEQLPTPLPAWGGEFTSCLPSIHPSIHPRITVLFKDRPLLPPRVIRARISALRPQTSSSPQIAPGLWF